MTVMDLYKVITEHHRVRIVINYDTDYKEIFVGRSRDIPEELLERTIYHLGVARFKSAYCDELLNEFLIALS